MQQARSPTKIGYFVSLAFILQGGLSLVRVVVFPESFGPDTPHVSSLIAALLLVAAVLFMMHTQPRDVWKAWSASFGSAAIVSFLGWLSIMDGLFEVVVYMIFLGCNLYAFFEFRRCLKRGECLTDTE